MSDRNSAAEGRHLEGLKIVLTGDFKSHERDAATRLLEARGASVTSAVSGKTSVLIAGANAGDSKLGQARKRNLPILDEAQLLALLAGQTLEQVLAGSAPPASPQAGEKGDRPAEKPPAVPFPVTALYPRHGVYTEHFPGTAKVRVQGSFANGLKQGSWKKYDEAGQLREDYSYERGIAHGPELDWHANGVKSCDGNNHEGKRSGLWTWWHENGKVSYTYVYGSDGLRHGEHVWDLEDGSKRARGQFFEDKFHGHWTWWQEPGIARLERGYHHGLQHGLDEGWFREGELAYRRTYQYGNKEGLEEVYQEIGEGAARRSVLAFRGEWKGGFAVGEHLSVESTGKETLATFVCGLKVREGDAAIREKALKRLRKASDSYGKVDAMGEGVDYSERAPQLLHLWRAGQLDVALEPDLWELLGQITVFITGEEVVKLLQGIRDKENGYANFLPYWPDYLDRIVMAVYARDPGPIDAAAPTLPAPMRKGVAFVQARFGREPAVSLHSEMAALAHKHLEQYGLGHKIHWPDEHGRVVEQALFLDHKGSTAPLFSRFIALFGGEAAWRQALQKKAEALLEGGRLSFGHLRPVLEQASPEEMAMYIDAVALNSDTQDFIRAALTQWRQLDAATLVRIALLVKDDGLRKWPTVSEALLALAAEGKAAPPELVDALPLAVESPSYSSAWCTDPLRSLTDEQKKDPAFVASSIPIEPGCAVPRIRRLREALATLPREVLVAKLERQLAADYSKSTANQFLYLVPDPDLWKRAIQSTEGEPYGSSDGSTYGLGDLGEPGLPLLVALQKRVKGREWKEGVAKAFLVALARTIVDKGTFPPELDKHVSFSSIAKDYDYRFFEAFLHRIIHLLPTERAEPLLLEGLASKHFARAFRMIGSHPSAKILRAAFTELLAREATLKSEEQAAVGLGIGSLPNARAWVKWIFQCGGGGGMESALRDAIGHAGIEEIRKELAAAGVEKPAEIDHVEKVRRRAEAEGGGSERIYLLRRLEGEGHGTDLNRIGGPAPGVDAARWPEHDGEPMVHLFTLDLDTMPELRALVSTQDGGVARAVSVFCWHPDLNEAFTPDTDQTAVLVSSEAQIKAPAAPPTDLEPMPPARFEPVPVQVKPSVWRNKSGDLRSEIYRTSGRALGDPIWLQSPEHFGHLLCQFDDSFIHMNLGDTGVMYVFPDAAFWQCH